MTDYQRQQWKDALAALHRGQRRYRAKRTGLGKVSGAGMVRITKTTAAEVAAAAPPIEE